MGDRWIMTKYVTRKNRKIANARGMKIIREFQKRLSPDYKIEPRLVGSAKYNTVVCDNKGIYDVDYQLVLTKNCRYFDANKVHKDFFRAFNTLKCKGEKVEASTSVITVRVSNSREKFAAEKETFSFDFAIILEKDEGLFILRRNGVNNYTWNRLPSRSSYIYQKFYSLSHIDQKIVIEHVIERKIKEKRKAKDKRTPSSVIFIEEVNNYGDCI